MRRLAHAIPVVVAVLAGLLVPRAAPAAPVFLVSGFGFGHGVGMGQYGALGQARKGATFDEILARYYPGTQLGPAPVQSVRVLLVSGTDSVAIASDSAFTVIDGSGSSHRVDAGTVRFGADLVVPIAGEPRELGGPLRFEPGEAPLELGLPYRGALVVFREAGLLRIVNDVALEQYLYGVVPGEMPPDWPAEALKAQAVAARSYALASRNPGGSFDLYADTRSQVYGGIRREDRRSTSAIDATAGQVLLHQGRVATTFFSSSSGGRTAAVEDAFPGSRPIPYLVSVEDPEDDVSPYHRWGPVVFEGAELAGALGGSLRGIHDVLVSPTKSGRAGAITVIAEPAPVEIPGWTVRNTLGLRSSWFSFGVLDVHRPARVPFGARARIGGIARGVERARLEARRRGGDWQPLADLSPADDGSFAVAVRASETLSLRVTAPALEGSGVEPPSAVLRVAPRVRVVLGKLGTRRAIAGTVRPKRGRVPVVLQVKTGRRWERVASGRTGEDGAFRLAARRGAVHRVVVTMPGFVRGVSNVVEVPA